MCNINNTSIFIYYIKLCVYLTNVSVINKSFPGSSNSKEPTCNVGDLGSIPVLGRTRKKDMATHSSVLAWRIPKDKEAWRATVHGVAKSRTRLSD